MTSFIDSQDMGQRISSRLGIQAIEKAQANKYHSLPPEIDAVHSLYRKSVIDQQSDINSAYRYARSSEVYPKHSPMTTNEASTETILFRDQSKIKTLQDKIQHLSKQINEPNPCMILLCGISSYVMSTNAILEKQAIEELLEKELAKPLDPSATELDDTHLDNEYQDIKKVAYLQRKIQELDGNTKGDRCCYFCYGSSAVAYTSYRLTKLQDLRYQLGKEIEKPIRHCQK